jgi:hypothetical protein
VKVLEGRGTATILLHSEEAKGATQAQPLGFSWRPQGDLNPCYRLERPKRGDFLSGPSTCIF